MQNVKAEVKGNILTLTVNLSERLGPSSTGKTVIVATSNGSAKIPGVDAVRFGLNVYTARPL